MAEIWQEFLQGAETFERCAKATLSPKVKTWRTSLVTSTMERMCKVTEAAWNQGLLTSIMPLVNYLDQSKTPDRFLMMLTRRRGIKEPSLQKDPIANLFVSLAGFTSWTCEKNDKTEWDIDESGETVFFVPPITYYYFEPGLLTRWGLVESGQIYIGESNGDEDVSFDDNKLTPENRARVLQCHAEVCRFLGGVASEELSKKLPPSISAIEVADRCEKKGIERKTIQNWMSDPTFPRPIRTGRNRVFIRQNVVTWLKTNKGIEL